MGRTRESFYEQNSFPMLRSIFSVSWYAWSFFCEKMDIHFFGIKQPAFIFSLFLWVRNLATESAKLQSKWWLGLGSQWEAQHGMSLLPGFSNVVCSQAALVVEPTCLCRRCKRQRFDPWVGKMPWSKKWQPSPVLLLEETHGQRSLVGYSSLSCKESDTTEAI